MRTWSVYRLDNGQFIGQTLCMPEADLAMNVTAGHGVALGEHDHLSRRVDTSQRDALLNEARGAHKRSESLAEFDETLHLELATVAAIIDFRPARPNDQHEWDETSRRWRLHPEVAAMNQEKAKARTEIHMLEAKQARVLREIALNQPGAKERLQRIDDRIAELRLTLQPPS